MPASSGRMAVASYCADDRGGVGLFDPAGVDGRWRLLSRVSGLPDVLALAAHPDGRTIYATSGVSGGSVLSIAVADDGSLARTSIRSSHGALPCALSVAPDGTALVTANYGDGTVAVHPIDARGELGEASQVVRYEGRGPDPDRQDRSHAHAAVFDRAGRVVVTDLGGDALYRYDLDATGRLVPLPNGYRTTAPPGSGPRHVAFGSSGLLTSDELSSSLSRYREDDDGELVWAEAVALDDPSAAGRNYPSEVSVGADRRFAYVGNRGRDTIAVVALTGERLEVVQQFACGEWPIHFVLDGDRLHCAARDSDAVITVTVDEVTGRLGPAERVASVTSPSWLVPVPVPVPRPEQPRASE